VKLGLATAPAPSSRSSAPTWAPKGAVRRTIRDSLPRPELVRGAPTERSLTCLSYEAYRDTVLSGACVAGRDFDSEVG
jgi:hypothetical protein